MLRSRVRRCLLGAGLALARLDALAVSPLVVDDADTVERGRLQLNLVWFFDELPGGHTNLVPVNPVVGLTTRGEVGLSFGYLRHETDVPPFGLASGPFDVILGSKWKLVRSEGGLQLTGRVDVKFPSASESDRLGSGDTDLGGFLIATRCWGDVCFDWNVGYLAAALSRGASSDDSWFLGQAVRFSAGERWTIMTEAWGRVPSAGSAPPATGRAQAGVQYGIRENFLVAGLAGAGFGHDAPGLVTTVGLTWVF